MALSDEELALDAAVRSLNLKKQAIDAEIISLKAKRREVTLRREFLFKNPQYADLSPIELERVAGDHWKTI